MDPLTISVLKAVAATSPVAGVLLLAVITLWKDNKAKESCKDPLNDDPKVETCNRCLACKDRHLAEKDAVLSSVLDKLGADHAEAIKHQEEAHLAEAKLKEEQIKALQDKNENLMREIIKIFQGSSTTEE